MMTIEILIVSSMQKTPDINLDITKTFPPWSSSKVMDYFYSYLYLRWSYWGFEGHWCI